MRMLSGIPITTGYKLCRLSRPTSNTTKNKAILKIRTNTLIYTSPSGIPIFTWYKLRLLSRPLSNTTEKINNSKNTTDTKYLLLEIKWLVHWHIYIYSLSLSLLTLYLDPPDPLILLSTNRLQILLNYSPLLPTYFPLPLYNPTPH